ncbi:hypothetical protein SD81_036040 [Tolypothrix campylonemoides VB511288]|nr:hypothetical protein SD81_036040 [Tolypothrix campylonemoides VB511288]
MPAPLKVYLTSEEDELLRLVSQAKDIPPRTRSRATALRLSSRLWTVTQIAEYFEDPDMRHGLLSRSQRFDGYKRHVLRDLEIGVVRSVGLTSANIL